MSIRPSLTIAVALLAACAAPPEAPSPEHVRIRVTNRAPNPDAPVMERRRVALLAFEDETQRGPAAFARGSGTTVEERAAAAVEALLLASGRVELVAPADADLVIQGNLLDLGLAETSRSNALSRSEDQSATATLRLRLVESGTERTLFDGTATGVATRHAESLRVLGQPEIQPPDVGLIDGALARAVELMSEDLIGSLGASAN